MNELNEWLKECLHVFPSLKKMKIGCLYKKLPKNTLGRVKGKVIIKNEINAEALLLEGKVKKKIVREKPKEYEIEINEKLKNIKKVFRRYNELRKLNGLPLIKRREDLDMAINKVIESL